MPGPHHETDGEWLDRVYRIAAEHSCQPVLDAIHERHPKRFRTPDRELKLAALIARGRQKELPNAES